MTEQLTGDEEREIVKAEKRNQDASRREAKANHKKQTAKPPKQPRLPGTGDAPLGKLEELAEEYYDYGRRRAQLKLDILDEMKRLKKKHYAFSGLEGWPCCTAYNP